jgi:hypothetical protein
MLDITEHFMKKYVSRFGLFLFLFSAGHLEAMEDMSIKAEEHKRVQTAAYFQLFEPIHPLQSRKTLGQIYAADGIYNDDETSLQEINQRGKRCLDFLIQRGFKVQDDLKDEGIEAVPVLEQQSTPLAWLKLRAKAARETYIFLMGKEPSSAWIERYVEHTKFLMQALRDAGARDVGNKQITQ